MISHAGHLNEPWRCPTLLAPSLGLALTGQRRPSYIGPRCSVLLSHHIPVIHPLDAFGDPICSRQIGPYKTVAFHAQVGHPKDTNKKSPALTGWGLFI